MLYAYTHHTMAYTRTNTQLYKCAYITNYAAYAYINIYRNGCTRIYQKEKYTGTDIYTETHDNTHTRKTT